METLTYEKVVHLVNRKSGGNAVTKCHEHFNYDEGALTSAEDVVPTCPKCLSSHFYHYKTNYRYQKMAAEAEKRVNTLTMGLAMLTDAQQTKYASGGCEENRKGSFPFIPMNMGSALRSFEDVREILRKERRWSGHHKLSTSFLDAGCGVGNIMLLAKICELADQCHGVEFFDDTANRARNWLGLDNERLTRSRISAFKIFQDNILTFSDYGKYDIIYFYCPLCDHNLQIQFEERLEDEMKLGAILIPRMKRSFKIGEDYRFENLSKSNVYEPCFIKVKEGKRRE